MSSPLFLQLEQRSPPSQRLSLALTPEGLLTLAPAQLAAPRHVPPTYTDPAHYQINLDVHHFTPEELTVKASNGFLFIQASHEEKREDDGWVKRSITRRYPLPESCNVESIDCRLSSDGVLSVMLPAEGGRGARVVPIVQTGPMRAQPDGKPEIGDGEAAEAIAPTLPVV